MNKKNKINKILIIYSCIIICFQINQVIYSNENKEFNGFSLPDNEDEWSKTVINLKKTFIRENFKHWNNKSIKNASEVITYENKDLILQEYKFFNYKSKQLTLYILHSSRPKKSSLIVLNPLTEEGLTDFLSIVSPVFEKYLKKYPLPKPNMKSLAQHQRMFSKFDWAMAYLIPSGLKINNSISGKNINNDTTQKFQMEYDKFVIGDIRRAIQTLRNESDFENIPLWIQAEKNMAVLSLYASIFETNINRLDLYNLGLSKEYEIFFKNKTKYLNISNALSISIKKTNIILYEDAGNQWKYANAVARKLGWVNKIKIRKFEE